MFHTVWDCAASGANIQLKQVLDQMTYRAGVAPKDQKTWWLGNTPLMIAIKHQQLETIKQLVQTYKADLDVQNARGKKAIDIAKASIKDPNVLTTALKLLQMQSASTRVVHNREALEENKQVRQEKAAELKRLRDTLKEKLQQQGINVKETFSRFDANGDGVFNHMEFEMIFTVLGIDFTKD